MPVGGPCQCCSCLPFRFWTYASAVHTAASDADRVDSYTQLTVDQVPLYNVTAFGIRLVHVQLTLAPLSPHQAQRAGTRFSLPTNPFAVLPAPLPYTRSTTSRSATAPTAGCASRCQSTARRRGTTSVRQGGA